MLARCWRHTKVTSDQQTRVSPRSALESRETMPMPLQGSRKAVLTVCVRIAGSRREKQSPAIVTRTAAFAQSRSTTSWNQAPGLGFSKTRQCLHYSFTEALRSRPHTLCHSERKSGPNEREAAPGWGEAHLEERFPVRAREGHEVEEDRLCAAAPAPVDRAG